MRSPIRLELPTPYSVGPVNSYLLLGDRPALVDCGMRTDKSLTALENELAAHGLTVGDIGQVVITHAHVDHMGAIGWIADNSDATIWVNEYCYPFAVDLENRWQERVLFTNEVLERTGMPEKKRDVLKRYFGTMTAMWDAVSAERVRQFAVDEMILIGDRPWQSIYLPGHASMQTGFYQPDEQWLFSADCLLPISPIPVIERDPLNLAERSRGLRVHLQSLERLSALEVSGTYPGHGKRIDDHRRLIAAQLARIEQRKEACFGLLRDGKRLAWEVSDVMYAHYPQAAKYTGLCMVLGYLDLLSAENRITRHLEGGEWIYELA